MAIEDPISSASISKSPATRHGSTSSPGAIDADVGPPRVQSERHVDGHLAGLDGLRGVAIVLVVAYHVEPETFSGGFIALSLFFALSGYLITHTLLTRLHDASVSRRRQISDFYRRRVRRLAPMSLATLAGVAVIWGLGGWADPDLGRDLGWGLAQMANWNAVVEGSQYRVATETSPLMHLWSLSIEEQIYLLMPLVVIGVSRVSRVLLAGIGALVIAAVATVVHGGDLGVIYFATHVRLGEVAWGIVAAAAVSWVGADSLRARIPPRVVTAVGVGGLALIGVITITMSLATPAVAWGALLAFGALSALVVTAAVLDRDWGRRLDIGPLAWLGRRSYAIYLVHWPIMVGCERAGLESMVAPVTIVGSVAIAALTFTWFEMPIRRRAWGRWPVVLAGPAVVTIAVTAVVLGRTDRDELDLTEARERLASLSTPGGLDTQPPSTMGITPTPSTNPMTPSPSMLPPVSSPSPSSEPAAGTDVEGSESVTDTSAPDPVPTGPVRYGVVGDSTGLAYTLGTAMAGHPDTELGGHLTELGCPLGRGGRLLESSLSPVPIIIGEQCRWDRRLADAFADGKRVDVVLVMFGNWDVRKRSVAELGERFVSLTDPAARAWLMREADLLTDTLLDIAGDQVVWVTIPEIPGDVETGAVAAYNAIVAAQTRHPSGCVTRLDLGAWIDTSGERDRLLPDDVHLSWEPDGGTAAEVEERFVAARLRDLVDQRSRSENELTPNVAGCQAS